MSVKVMSMVWAAFPSSGSELICMLAMADWANDEGGSLHPSMRAIAEKVRVSEKQARRIVHGLVADGYLTVVGNAQGGCHGSTKNWVMNVPKLNDLVAAKAAKIAQKLAESDVQPLPLTGAVPLPLTGAVPLPLTGAVPLPPVSLTPPMGVHDPSHGCPLPLPPMGANPSINHHRTTIEPPSISESDSAIQIVRDGVVKSLPIFDQQNDSAVGVIESRYASATKAMRMAGMANVNPGNLQLMALVNAGVPSDVFFGAAAEAVRRGKGFAYALVIVESQLCRAAATTQNAAAGLHAGPPPSGIPKAQPKSFAQQDREAGWARWEEMTGRVHPDRQQNNPITIDVEPAGARHELAIQGY